MFKIVERLLGFFRQKKNILAIGLKKIEVKFSAVQKSVLLKCSFLLTERVCHSHSHSHSHSYGFVFQSIKKSFTKTPIKIMKALIFMTIFFGFFGVVGIEAEAKTELFASTKAKNEAGLRKGFKNLEKLSSFKNIVVLQRRYFPKTQRVFLSLRGASIINDAYFAVNGFGAEGGFYLTEHWGLNFEYIKFNSYKKQHTEKLIEDRSVLSSFTYPIKRTSVGIKWVPMYGKIAFRDKKITYFDHYFSLGYGSIELVSGSSPLIYIGTGQIFPFNKNWAFQWELVFNRYEAKDILDKSAVIVEKERKTERELEQKFDTLIFNIGLTFFYPGADYR